MLALTTAQLAALGTDQLQAIETADLPAITTADFATLSTTLIEAFTTDQIQALTTDQIVAFTSVQIQALTTDQIVALTSDQVIALQTQDIAAMSMTQISAIETSDVALMSGAQVDAMIGATPLVLDLDGNGVSTLAASEGVRFDVNATGTTEQVGWAAATDGLLVRDLNSDGLVNDGRELFGGGTQLASGQRAGNGYAALADLDSNHDGQITQADAAYGELKVWVDKDSDGVTDGGELRTLADLGIVSMDLGAQTGSATDNGNLLGLTSSYQTADGGSHQMADVWFAKQTTGSAGSGEVTLGDLLAEAPTELLPATAVAAAGATDGTAAASSSVSTTAAVAASNSADSAANTAAEADAALALSQHQIALDDLLRQQPLL